MQKFGYILLMGLLTLSGDSAAHGKAHHRPDFHEKFAHGSTSGGGTNPGDLDSPCIPPTCCNAKAKCPSTKPICTSVNATVNGKCVECLLNKDCSKLSPYAVCQNGECVNTKGNGCTTNSDCDQIPGAPYCCQPSDLMRCAPAGAFVARYIQCYTVRIPCHEVPLG